jgi:tetratricopeptide (TPR) repeat protein
MRLRFWKSAAKDEQAAYAEFKKGLDCFDPRLREQALRHFRAAIALKPDEGVFHLRIAATLEALGQIEEALREYHESIRLMPGEGGPFFCLGNLARGRGDLAGARENYVKALSMKLDGPLAGLCRGALAELGSAAEAPPVKSAIQRKSSETVAIKGVGTDAMAAVLRERLYMAEHPCECGGQWQRVRGGSAFPVVYSECVCTQCGAEKRFEFHLA